MTIKKHNREKDKAAIVVPEPDAEGLTTLLEGVDATGAPAALPVVTERPLTIYLNRQEIVTTMTVGDRPQEMAVGFLFNQNMLLSADDISAIDYDDELGVVVVRTAHETDFEDKIKKKIRTSGCAQGTLYGDIMKRFDAVKLPAVGRISTRQIIQLSKTVNMMPSLYLKAGAIHACVLCSGSVPLIYCEDIGRHNAADKVAGYMLLSEMSGHDKVFYTTGRLTSEMVIKTVLMDIPILISRSGFTEAGVRLARQAGLTLIGRARGRRFIALSGAERIEFDTPEPDILDEEDHMSAQRRLYGAKR
jgi:FdhD protein